MNVAEVKTKFLECDLDRVGQLMEEYHDELVMADNSESIRRTYLRDFLIKLQEEVL